MAKKARTFDLPSKIDRYLAALSKLYGQEGKRELQEILVNGQVRVHEEWTYDGLDGGVWGHALYLTIPEQLFLASVKRKQKHQESIREGLNALHNIQREFISGVFIEMSIPDENDWRRESGLIFGNKRSVSDQAAKRIWSPGMFRLFLSHKSSVKKRTLDLKEQLALFGLSGFVAHADIHPTKEWQEEIENALASMDGFITLMTPDFRESEWTDQEVGYAVATGVPMLAVQLGQVPYGFIGKFQAASSSWETAAVDIAKTLIKNDRVLASYTEALHRCPNFENANMLAKALTGIEKLTPEQADALVRAYNENYELRGGFGFNGNKPTFYGPGLVHYLNEFDPRTFRIKDQFIRVSSPTSE